ncbi:hypothetical protein RN001_004384 [Aquatica leii]|uniref:Transposase domain-containing protein n=1 Tax=Aquatica leii TaxID=1421715 RepID=A0AAN7P5A5_9COLE|nr:hypothetical protein RN001_004384 [Aquatica leii]
MNKIHKVKKYKVVSQRQIYRRVALQKQEMLHKLASQKHVFVESVVEQYLSDSDFYFNNERNSVAPVPVLNNSLINDDRECETSDAPIKFNSVCPNTVSEIDNAQVKVLSICHKSNLNDEIKYWATTSSTSCTDVTRLLHILKPHHPSLPLDYRTLVKTPTHIPKKQLQTGEYCHIGLLVNIQRILDMYVKQHNPKNLELSFNIDGLPLFHSNTVQLWPSLGQVKNVKCPPFAIGIFCGRSKPMPLETYLEDFIDELNFLLQNGFVYNKNKYSLTLRNFICDAPARSYLKCIKSHGGYASCEKCNVYGEYVDGRIILNSTSSPVRTDQSFLQQIDEEHHIGISPLLKLPIGMVTNFPNDYMHSCCLGVMKKLISFWLNGSLKTRLKSTNVRIISEHLVLLKNYIPTEFNRKPRTLQDVPRWKATEYRTFMLYVGPLVLKDVLDIAVFEHFLLFHTGMSILISPLHLSKLGSELAGNLLNTFINHCSSLYGKQFLIYNVHSLCHLKEDVQLYGPLDEFSAFPFENFLGRLKRLKKSTVHPLVEIYNRIVELNYTHPSYDLDDKIRLKIEHLTGPVIDRNGSYSQFKKLLLNNMTLMTCYLSAADSYCMTKTNKVIQIHNFITDTSKSNEIFIIGKEFLTYRSLYVYPFESNKLQIYSVSDLNKNLSIWSVEDVTAKCIVLPNKKRDQWVSFPLVHSLSINNY